jgi:glyoxylase-like metal-dependent hydrolase (beta-lactamase superfamily II)
MLNGNPVSEETGPGIHTIDAGYFRPGLAAVHLVVDSGEAAFIDTAVSHSVPRMLEALAQTGLAPADVRWVILTHIHLDHAGGAGALMQELPDAELLVHPRGAPHMVDPTKLVAGTIATYGEAEYRRLYGDIPPVDAARVRAVVDGETVTLGTRSLTFIDTPGHALHHHCVVDPANRLIFSGDTFGISYRDFDSDRGAFIFPATTPTHFDPDQAHASIDRLLTHRPEAIYLTHFSKVTEIDRLAADLHAELDAFVALAKASADTADLQDHLGAHLLARVEAHGCELPRERIAELLALDVALNAKGLMHWLSRIAS